MEKLIEYYKSLGAPSDQSALISLLKEVQQENGGGVPQYLIAALAEGLCIKESYLLAIIRRIPSLRLADTHLLEICAGPNCGKHAAFAAFAQKLESKHITVKFVPCMRMCGKGPNIKWDGKLYHQATPELLQKLIKG